MKPQDRVNAILSARVEPSWKILLVAIASHMHDGRLSMWASPETLAEESGLSRSTVMELLKAMAQRGIITRLDEGYRAKVTRIIWEALAAQEPSRSRRGGRQASDNRTDVSEHRTFDDRTAPSEGRTEASDNRTGNRPVIGLQASDNRTLTDKGTDNLEPTREPEGERPTQTITGPQATVVLPEPPLVESPLLSLLASSGMPMGQAASVARKLLEAGITSPTCEEAMVLDEWDLGRLAGPHKGRVVVAFRRAGWMPPKERRHQTIPALPSGLKVIDEKGNPIGVTQPATKAEKKAVEKDDWFGALQQLARTGDEANGK